MNINIHDVHVEALNFVASRCIDASNRWIKQCKVCTTALVMRHHGEYVYMTSQLCCSLRCGCKIVEKSEIFSNGRPLGDIW